MSVKWLINMTKRIARRVYSFFFMIIHKNVFGAFGNNVRVYRPLQIDGYENIFIGDNVTILDGVWLASQNLTGEKGVKLEIGSGTSIGHLNHIYSTKAIIIENNVLTADKVYISDNMHSYEDINVPIKGQSIKQCQSVVIGEGSWLGENVCVIGASVGKHCIIGANAVVTTDIPDYCVAVGVPARVIKRYDFGKNEWMKV
jgi:acetyltransferase-like isoleucine patch superfamily enzyme